jgi:hypothetical protein
MSVVDIPRTQLDQAPARVEFVPAPAPVDRSHEPGAHRWLLFLGVPFVLGACFFGLALQLNSTWPMVPAFFLGPLLMIGAYIYLMLTSESNFET